MYKNQRGFGITQILLIVVSIGLIVVAGIYVYNKHSETTKLTSTDSQDVVSISKPEVTDLIYSNVNVGGGEDPKGHDTPYQTQVISYFKKPLEVNAVSIEYGKDAKHFTSFQSASGSEVKPLFGNPAYVWELTDLQPGSKYYFHVGATVNKNGVNKIVFSTISSFSTPR